jgi:Predicted lactoylglutathione lyase
LCDKWASRGFVALDRIFPKFHGTVSIRVCLDSQEHAFRENDGLKGASALLAQYAVAVPDAMPYGRSAEWYPSFTYCLQPNAKTRLAMSRMIFVNLPVANLVKSKAFYEAIGALMVISGKRCGWICPRSPRGPN